ncbi:MAG: hypothetical protein ABSC10_06505 [Candidatus Acidiferrales bacterium]|jgi:hypothetical protein
MKSFRISLLGGVVCLLLPVWAAAQQGGRAAGATVAARAGNTINLPADTAVISRLVAKFDSGRMQVGDRVEARVSHDVKVGHQVVLPKGAIVVGQVAHFVAPPPGNLYGVVIRFDTVELKNGGTAALHLEIQAIAPPPVVSVNGITDQPYDGGNHVRADAHGVETLTADSRGVFSLPDVVLGIEVIGKGNASIINCTSQKIRLDRDSQIVFRVANP